MSFFKSNRCKICKIHRGNRFCLRIGKNICWHDCNEKRIDFKCPEECKYSLIRTENFQFKTNADSQTEFTELLKKEIDRWVILPQKIFNGEIPQEMVKTKYGQKRITDFFNNMKIPDYVPISYLNEKLYPIKIKTVKKISTEKIAMNFLNKIIEQNWEGTIPFLKNSKLYKDREYKENYIRRITQNKIFSKTTEYDIISSALSEDGEKALVYFELNNKFDLTIVFSKQNENWKINSKILGKPEIYNGENEAIKQIAVLISKNKPENVYNLLKKYSDIYVDSADFQYYWGLYYISLKNVKEAKEHFFNAMEMDPFFIESKYNYALLLHSENRIEKVKKLYQEILEMEPNDINSLNNLASILIDEKQYQQAKTLLERCLKVNNSFEIAKKNMERLQKLNNDS